MIQGSVEALSRFRSRPSGTAVCPGSLDLTQSTSSRSTSSLPSWKAVTRCRSAAASRCTWARSGDDPVRRRAQAGSAPRRARPRLAVQAIRAKAPAETKFGFGENVQVAVPIIHTASTPLTPRCSPLARLRPRGHVLGAATHAVDLGCEVDLHHRERLRHIRRGRR